MCYLLCLPSNIQPELDWLVNSLDSNNDGAGFTIATKSGQLITEHAVGITERFPTTWKDQKGVVHDSEKTTLDPQPMLDLAERFIKLRLRHPEGPAMWHARMATGGVETTAGCHPYKLGGGMTNTVLAHNGVMFSRPADWRSDTRIFAEDILPNQFRKFWRTPVRERMETYLGNGNKIAIITTNPKFMTRVRGGLSTQPFELFIFNEELGHWHKDAWHSNASYEKYTFKGYSNFSGGGWKGHGNWADTYDYDNEWSGYSNSRFDRNHLPSNKEIYTTFDYTTNTTTWHYPTDPDYDTARDNDRQAGVAYTCDYCKAYGGVDPVTNVCSICETCNDCGFERALCDCYLPRNARQPANLPVIPGHLVEPREITAGSMTNYQPKYNYDRPAIDGASPDEQRASFMAECYNEWEASDDPAVQAMKWEEYFTLREYEVKHGVQVFFEDLDQMDEWFAERAMLASMDKATLFGLESVAQASDDAKAAEALAEEVEDLLSDGDPGII